MFANYALLLSFLPITTIAQSTPTILCIAGQCLQGYSNTTIGAKLSFPGASTPIHLLPDVYQATTSPQLLHNALSSSSTSLISSPGFTNSTSISLPLNLALQAGTSTYTGSLYSGQASFSSLPTTPLFNSSTPIPAKALLLSSNVWVALKTGSNDRIIVWNAIPDVGQLPQLNQGSLSLLDMQSSACTPGCSASGVCTSSGTCQCSSGFTGVSCESCASGFFGPKCQSCPANCTTCDDGINGSGRCLKPVVANDPSTCKCQNGVCGSNGQCTCSAGFTTGNDGTLCSKCSPGFFLTASGDCQICNSGCAQCQDGAGLCSTCKSGFTLNANDKTSCNPAQQTNSGGSICPAGSFGAGASCTPCPSQCETCTGSSSNQCTTCAKGLVFLNNSCVSPDSNGICPGTNLIADNNKRECDSCGAKCTACTIPGFNAASVASQKKCTGCIPGFFLNNGTCVAACPTGTTVSSQDNLTCIPCDSSCSACAGSSTFCTSCSNNQLASGGRCVGTCPSGTFSASGSCLTCHPDCSTCSGGAFNQCSSCPSNRPVLTNGRCLPTCSKNQYFDATSSSCKACDSSCSSCSGPGSNNCLACSSSTEVLRSGACVASNCQSGTNVIPGLGVCLSELVSTTPSGTGTAVPLPTVTGLNSPTIVVKRGRLEWWQILLMALGCAFIFIVILWLCRRRQRRQRAKKSAVFASSGLNGAAKRKSTSWRWRLIRFGEKLFGHTRSKRAKAVPKIVHLGPKYHVQDDIKLATTLRDAEEARAASPLIPSTVPAGNTRTDRGDIDMVDFIGSYNRPRPPLPTRYYPHHPHHTRVTEADQMSISDASSQLSAPSMYSQMTGIPRRAPDPRQPLKKDLTSRFSASTYYGLGERSNEQSKLKTPFWK